MKARFKGISALLFFLVFCPVLFMIISCQKPDEDEKLQQPTQNNNFGVLQVQYTIIQSHRIMVTTNSGTIVKDSSPGQANDTIQLAPGVYSVFIGQLFSEQHDLDPSTFLDTTCTITVNNITMISVPF